MEKQEVMDRLQAIFRDVFDNDDIVLTDDTVAEDIDEWDSVSHVELTAAIQDEFGIKLAAQEILSWDCVGEMVKAIQHKIS